MNQEKELLNPRPTKSVCQDWKSLTLVPYTLYFTRYYRGSAAKHTVLGRGYLNHIIISTTTDELRKSTTHLARIVKRMCSSIWNWQRRSILEIQQKTFLHSKDSTGASNACLRAVRNPELLTPGHSKIALSYSPMCWSYTSKLRKNFSKIIWLQPRTQWVKWV